MIGTVGILLSYIVFYVYGRLYDDKYLAIISYINKYYQRFLTFGIEGA